VTEQSAPSWKALLVDSCTPLPNATEIREALFPDNSPLTLPLEEAAQVIDIELRRNGLTLHEEVAQRIRKLSLKGDNSAISKFLEKTGATILTTNYDKLAEELAAASGSQSIAPGLPIPRSSALVTVYHVHGSVDVPREMVVTSNDYFRFLNTESYFSRKLSTLLHENTVVILGYSLSDTNLKTILADYKAFTRNHSVSGSIILVARDAVPQLIKDYYAFSFGIRVIDSMLIHSFFLTITNALPAAEKSATSSRIGIRKVLYQKHTYVDTYLQLRVSFFEIVSAISAIGVSLTDPAVVALFSNVIDRKRVFTNESGAWEQYGHLASWLVYLASLIDIEGTSLQPIFLEAARRSLSTMSKSRELGYSWQAYNEWSDGWQQILPANRVLIRAHAEEHCTRSDALSLVKRP
jgi:hypothetical protein